MPRGSVGLNGRIARLENIVQSLQPRVDTLFQQNENLLNNPWVPQGSWAASTNTPTLANGDAADAGSSYVASDGGTVDFGAGGITFAGGDLVSKNAAGVWFKSAGLGSVIAGDATVADARATLDVMTVGGVNSRQMSKVSTNGVYLDGVDDYINFGDQALLEFGDSSADVKFSETFIFEIDDLTAAFPLSSKITGSAPNNERSIQVLTNGKIEAKLYDSSTAVYIGQTGATVLTTGRPYFAAVTYDGSGTSAGIKIYVGSVAESLTLTEAGAYTAMHAGSAHAYLGRVSSTYGKGKIYSYAPWNRELSAADVALLSINGNQPQPTDRWAGATSTSGTLTVGQRYRITTFVAGDDFTNVGAGSNATGVEFVATGTTPATWSNSSTLTEIGALASIQGRNLESDSAIDESSNELDGVFTGGATRLFEPKAQVSGVFTPQLYFGASLQTVSSANGYWWKDSVNEDIINFSIRIDSPSAVTDVGNVTVQGLPFVSVNDSTRQKTPEITPFNLTGLSGDVKALVVSNSDDINIYQMTSTGAAALTNASMTTSTVLYITGSYQKA